MTDKSSNLLLLFQKPLEPVFMPKDNGKTVIELPPDYYEPRYQQISSRFNTDDDVENRVALVPFAPPDLSFTYNLAKNAAFSLFNQKHKEIAAKLTKIFMDAPDEATLLSLAAYAKDRVNVRLFHYALSVAVEHRLDTRHLDLPSIVQSFPNQFVDPSAFPEARKEQALVTQVERRSIDIPLNFTANDSEPEQRMAYFREGEPPFFDIDCIPIQKFKKNFRRWSEHAPLALALGISGGRRLFYCRQGS